MCSAVPSALSSRELLLFPRHTGVPEAPAGRRGRRHPRAGSVLIHPRPSSIPVPAPSRHLHPDPSSSSSILIPLPSPFHPHPRPTSIPTPPSHPNPSHPIPSHPTDPTDPTPPLLAQAGPRGQLQVQVEFVAVRELLHILLRSGGPRGQQEGTGDTEKVKDPSGAVPRVIPKNGISQERWEFHGNTHQDGVHLALHGFAAWDGDCESGMIPKILGSQSQLFPRSFPTFQGSQPIPKPTSHGMDPHGIPARRGSAGLVWPPKRAPLPSWCPLSPSLIPSVPRGSKFPSPIP